MIRLQACFVEWEPNDRRRVTGEFMAESGVEGRSLLPLSTLLVLSEDAEALWASSFPCLGLCFPCCKMGGGIGQDSCHVAVICGSGSRVSCFPIHILRPFPCCLPQLPPTPKGLLLLLASPLFRDFIQSLDSSRLSPSCQATCPGAQLFLSFGTHSQ